MEGKGPQSVLVFGEDILAQGAGAVIEEISSELSNELGLAASSKKANEDLGASADSSDPYLFLSFSPDYKRARSLFSDKLQAEVRSHNEKIDEDCKKYASGCFSIIYHFFSDPDGASIGWGRQVEAYLTKPNSSGLVVFGPWDLLVEAETGDLQSLAKDHTIEMIDLSLPLREQSLLGERHNISKQMLVVGIWDGDPEGVEKHFHHVGKLEDSKSDKKPKQKWDVDQINYAFIPRTEKSQKEYDKEHPSHKNVGFYPKTEAQKCVQSFLRMEEIRGDEDFRMSGETVWVESDESFAFDSYVMPIALELSKGQQVVTIEYPACPPTIPDNSIVLLRLNAESLGIDDFRHILRCDRDESLSSYILNRDRLLIIHIHNIHKTKEVISGFIRSLIDGRFLTLDRKKNTRVFISGCIHGNDDILDKANDPGVISRTASFGFCV